MSVKGAKREILKLYDTWIGLAREIEQQASILSVSLVDARNVTARELIREHDDRSRMERSRDAAKERKDDDK